MIQEDIAEYDNFEEFSSSKWIASEQPTRDLNTLLEDLHTLRGPAFVAQLKYIATHRAFTPINGEMGIYSVGGEHDADFENLLNAARKAVEHGYRVFILPNPKGIRTADFIFERKGVFKMFDLKTIFGKNSVGNRLFESIGQTNRVLLNMAVDYNPVALARNIKLYFEKNPNAIEVLVFKGRKSISVIREDAENRIFHKIFIAKYIK
ncbi:hypothetical protein [Prevotella sp. P6B4]|uniref:hypothetical protein n=1 Tax=Prevotella sp. P6B4 TaxID=1410614 RepID=UPI0004915E42|nr:hypothetical protein [Prevotella sp. P6B4]